MRKAWWTSACLGAAILVALGFFAAYWVAEHRMLPRLAEMTAACGRGSAAAPSVAATRPPDARCRAYFADVELFRRTALTQTAITGLVAAFVLLVLRFRVRPLRGPARTRGRG
jgi:hypothetical protein